MKDEQNQNNLNSASGVICTDENSQNNQSEPANFSIASKISGLFGDGESSDKKKDARNIIIIIVCVLLTYIILSSHYSEEPITKEEMTPAMMEEEMMMMGEGGY